MDVESDHRHYSVATIEENNPTDYRKVAIVVIIILFVIAAIVVPTSVVLTMNRNENSFPFGGNGRVECPFNGLPDEKECVDRGCLWEPVSLGPSCYLPKESNHIIAGQKNETEDGFFIHLTRFSNITLFSEGISNVTFWVRYHSNWTMTFQFVDTDKFEVPKTVDRVDEETRMYKVVVNEGLQVPFQFKILRTADNVTIWDSSLSGMVLEDQFSQIATRLPSSNIYGMGDNPHGKFRRDLDYTTWPIFPRNFLAASSSGKTRNGHGFHPLYLCLEKEIGGKSHAVMFNDYHAMEYVLLPEPGIVFRSLSSSLSFTVVVGDDIKETMSKVAEVLGKPPLIPYWSLGLQIVAEQDPSSTIDYAVQNEIPFDVVELDPSLWLNGKIFDEKHYKHNFAEFMPDRQNLHWTIVLDPAIAIENYTVYNSGVQKGCFVKWSAVVPEDKRSFPSWPNVNKTDEIMFGSRSKSEPRAFPDFFKNRCVEWWKKLLLDLKGKIPYHGIYVVNNEPYSSGTNEDTCNSGANKSKCWELICPDTLFDDPLYRPEAARTEKKHSRLSDGTLCMAASMGENDDIHHYDVHTYYGNMMANISNRACEEDGKRCLTVAQSTSFSSDYSLKGKRMLNSIGHYVADVQPTWEDLGNTIIKMFDYNLFGTPYTGAQICAGVLDTSELCKRWMELAIFYPLAKIRLDVKNLLKSSYRVELFKKLQEVMQFRYWLLPYFYTVFYEAQLNGHMVIRPLYYDFPNENVSEYDRQFMWGPSLMVAPIVEETKSHDNDWKIYYPNVRWYKLRIAASKLMPESGKIASVDGIGEVPMFVKGGTILPLHHPDATKNNSYVSRQAPLMLGVFPDESDTASGSLYWDDGVSVDNEQRFLYFTFEFKSRNISIKRNREFIDLDYYNTLKEELKVGTIKVHDVEKAANKVTINGRQEPYSSYYSNDHRILILNFENINLLENKKHGWHVYWE